MGGTATDPTSYTRAVLNILADFSEEKTRLADVQRAMSNILEDSGAEKQRLGDAQKATLNILEDFSDERASLAGVQRAVLNILDDSAGEKARLEATQKAVLNILDDFDAEKNKVEQANREMTREIAERKQAEVALRHAKAAADAANRELEAFSYSVAHDLRAPLRSIDGFSQALLEDCADQIDEVGKTYLGRVRQSAQQMGQLIDDLLALSRVSRSEIHRQRVDLASIARTVLKRLGEGQPDRALDTIIPDEAVAIGDARLLGIALENLLGNAWKFTSRRVGARIEFGHRLEPERSVYFVRDNGAGFDMTYAHKLFGVFQRLHSASEFEGTGIGLVTVQRIIHRHGGQVWADGVVDRGATFYFTLDEGT
jgi:light-regulated signal transduction histidine kinase (bacteriophytochrome)